MTLSFKRKRQNRKEKGEITDITIRLDRQSAERLARLKRKMDKFNPMDERELLAMALEGFEGKLDRILKRQVRKRILALKKQGLSVQQIASRLNEHGIPTITERDGWDREAVSQVLEKSPNPAKRNRRASVFASSNYIEDNPQA